MEQRGGKVSAGGNLPVRIWPVPPKKQGHTRCVKYTSYICLIADACRFSLFPAGKEEKEGRYNDLQGKCKQTAAGAAAPRQRIQTHRKAGEVSAEAAQLGADVEGAGRAVRCGGRVCARQAGTMHYPPGRHQVRSGAEGRIAEGRDSEAVRAGAEAVRWRYGGKEKIDSLGVLMEGRTKSRFLGAGTGEKTYFCSAKSFQRHTESDF